MFFLVMVVEFVLFVGVLGVLLVGVGIVFLM